MAIEPREPRAIAFRSDRSRTTFPSGAPAVEDGRRRLLELLAQEGQAAQSALLEIMELRDLVLPSTLWFTWQTLPQVFPSPLRAPPAVADFLRDTVLAVKQWFEDAEGRESALFQVLAIFGESAHDALDVYLGADPRSTAAIDLHRRLQTSTPAPRPCLYDRLIPEIMETLGRAPTLVDARVQVQRLADLLKNKALKPERRVDARAALDALLKDRTATLHARRAVALMMHHLPGLDASEGVPLLIEVLQDCAARPPSDLGGQPSDVGGSLYYREDPHAPPEELERRTLLDSVLSVLTRLRILQEDLEADRVDLEVWTREGLRRQGEQMKAPRLEAALQNVGSATTGNYWPIRVQACLRMLWPEKYKR